VLDWLGRCTDIVLQVSVNKVVSQLKVKNISVVVFSHIDIDIPTHSYCQHIASTAYRYLIF
jgi:hypothetical protein